ncbi:FKBP-type peptidyl-prolyl cis-trans isomerase [Algoriphagus sediminis]|uniref:Peptidyl-prolyl cis-trans isomerase n=1 Tax=Algoriphagus sediminis TaxID=3057113 RepID=A0ABT7YFP1_9BACT|nr:FKBP-type peptidyl-prolyl cis-trans isomerase [Algoriphagus sediminis]MDN3205336.1 FKBP-type peptidyl-prolyl cis-trans isomerase [Algoriphagus sediminis]
MKRSIFFFSILIYLAACSGPSGSIEEAETGDTIQTETGLRYVFLKRGEGKKAEKGSMLDTKLSLMVEDSVVWNSYEAPDSLFSFILGYDPVISGFEEMAYLMKEGDNVLAILPDSLAYGDDGASDVIPPNATLVYDRYEIVSVSEPKLPLSDTLSTLYDKGGVDLVVASYEEIISTESVLDFHMELEFIFPFIQEVIDEGKFEDSEELSRYFLGESNNLNDRQTFRYALMLTYEGKEEFDKALEIVDEALKEEPEQSFLLSKKEELESKI